MTLQKICALCLPKKMVAHENSSALFQRAESPQTSNQRQKNQMARLLDKTATMHSEYLTPKNKNGDPSVGTL